MSVTVKCGTFAAPTTNASTSTITLGFSPVAIIMWADSAGATENAWNTGGAQMFVGLCGNNGGAWTQGGISYASYTGGATTAAHNSSGTEYGVLLPNAAGSGWSIAALFYTITSTGFTIYWTYAPTVAINVNYIALSGDVNIAAVVGWQAQTSAGTQSVTTVGFEPSLVIHLSVESTTTGFGNNAVMMLGAMDNNGNQFVTYTSSKTGVATSATQRAQSANYCIQGTGGTTAITWKASVPTPGTSPMLSNGFRVNWATPPSSAYHVISLCISSNTPNDLFVGNWNKNTIPAGCPASCTDTETTLLGSLTGALFFTDSYPTSATAVGGSRISIGGYDGTTTACAALQEKNAAATYVLATGTWNNETIIVADNDTQTNQALAAATFSGSNISVPWGTNSSSATQIGYIAFGQASYGQFPGTQNFTLNNNGHPALVTLILGDSGGDWVSQPSATITLTVAGLTKSTSDNTIFSASPTYTNLSDPYGPRFIIHFLPSDIAPLNGSYTYTLSVTTTTYGTQNFNGTMTIVTPLTINVSKYITLGL